MDIHITYRAGISNEDFVFFEISFASEDNILHSVSTKFDFKQLWSFSRDKTTVAFDFLVFSTIVYCVDRCVNRAKFSIDGWRRELNVVDIPVMNVDAMNGVSDELANAVSFLTGDD